MAITILNPARFNDDGGLGTRRFVRAAFFDEGYGSSNRLSGYAQGAGIVPATAPFNGIGAGTVGDPLRLSQFSNFTVPSLTIFTTQVTEGDYVDGGYQKIGYARDAELFPAIGSVSNATINGSSQFTEFAWRTVPFKGGSTSSLNFRVTGDQVYSGWSNLNYNGYDFDLTASFVGYDSGSNITSWFLSGGLPTFTGAGTVRTLTIT